jgi:FkbM family methyltransferase
MPGGGCDGNVYLLIDIHKMGMLNRLRKAARQYGVEVHRYNMVHSLDFRFHALLRRQQVDLVIDVGANDGGYGRYIRDGGYTGSILSFEPLPDAHSSLDVCAKRDPAWTVAPRVALGAESGIAQINVAGNSKSSSLLPMLDQHINAAPHSATVGSTAVAVNRLDDINLPVLTSAKRPFLKIDTQGYEMPVLMGAEATLERCVGVQLEMSLVPLYGGQELYPKLIAFLSENGFDLWGVLPGFVDPDSGRLLQMDGVFFRS